MNVIIYQNLSMNMQLENLFYGKIVIITFEEFKSLFEGI